MSFFKNSENNKKKEGGPDISVSDIQFPSDCIDPFHSLVFTESINTSGTTLSEQLICSILLPMLLDSFVIKIQRVLNVYMLR